MSTEMLLLHRRIEELKEGAKFLLKCNKELQEISKNACKERPMLLRLERATRAWFKDECGEEYGDACTQEEEAVAGFLDELDIGRGEGAC